MSDLKVQVTSQGGAAAAADVGKLTKAVEGTAAAAKNAEGKAKEAGTAVDAFGKRGSAAKDAFEGLTTATNGGAGAIFGLSKAWLNLKEAFAANPVAAGLGLVLGLLGLIQKGLDLFVQRAENARNKMFGTGEQTKKLAAEMAALETATDTALKNAGTDADALKSKFGELVSQIDTVLNRFKLLETAKTNAALGDLEVERQTALNGATNPEQAATINRDFDNRAAGIRRRSSDATSTAEVNATLAKVAAAVNAQGDAQNLITKADEAASAATGPRERDAANKIAAEVRAKQTAVIAKLEDEIVGYETQLQAARINEKAVASTDTARSIVNAREERAAITGPAIISARESALRIARQAPDAFRPEGYQPDLFKSPEARATQYAEVQDRNSARQAAIARAAAGVEKAAGKLGDERDEAGDLQRLEAALTNLANAASLNGNRALKQLTDRINTIEAQLKHTDR